MKKTVILLLGLFALGCFWWYVQGERQHKAEELIWAAYDADLIAVKNALENGAETGWALYVDDPQRHYQNAELTPMLAAASGGNEDVINFLIKQGEDVNQTNAQGWTPLFVAARDGNAEAAKLLVYRKADANRQTDTGATALMLTLLAQFPSEKQRLSLLQYLLKRGADPNLQTMLGTDALYYALTELKNAQALDLLLEHGADPCRIYNGQNVLELAKANKTPALQLSALKKARAGKCSLQKN